jgi:hypothetical protein
MLMNYQQACDWLDVDASTTLDESILKTAFRKSAMREHPDKSDHTEATHRFQCVQHAHEYLLKCVARNATGPTANYDMYNNDDEDDDYDNEEDEDDYEYYEDGENPFEDLFRAFHMHFGIHVHFGGPGGGMGGMGGGPPPSRDDYYARQREEERRYDEYMERLYRRTREREEEKMRKEQERQQELFRKRQQAQADGRDFFEAWNIKALQQEATKRGLKCKGMQQQSIVELLIEDETKKRLRRQLKEQAILVEEWCQVVNLESQPEWNGKKVRAIDFFESKWTRKGYKYDVYSSF